MTISIQTAYDAMQAKDFKTAFEFFGKLHETTTGGLSAEYLRSAAYAAQQLNKFAKAREWLLLALTKEPTNENLKTAMVWLSLAVMRDKGDQLSQRQAVTTVEELLKLNPMQAAIQSALTAAIMLAAGTFETMANTPVLTLGRWYARVNRPALNIQPRTIRKNGREITVPSEAETFYNHYCTMLYESARYEQCIVIAREGLDRLKEPGKVPSKWISRRLAMSLAATRQFEEADRIYSTHLNYRPDWFILYEHSRILHQLGRADDAYQKGAEALNAAGDWKLKINVLLWMADRIPDSNPKLRLALLLMAKEVRAKNGWTVPPELENRLSKLKSHLDPLIHHPTQLDGFISSAFKKEFPKLSGKVTRVFDNGTGGFITSTDGKSFYFSAFVWLDKVTPPSIGLKVNFEATESFDKKTNQMRPNAIKVIPVRS